MQVRKRSGLLLNLLKWITLIAIGIIAVTTVDFRSVLENVGTFPAQTIALFFGLVAVSHLFYDLRLLLIAGSMGIRPLSLSFTVRLNLLSEFVSIVLPSYLGGDGLRLLRLRPYADSRTAAVCVLVDRLVGLVTLGIATLIWLPSVLELIDLPLTMSPSIILLITAGAVIGVVVAVRLAPRVLSRLGLSDLCFDLKTMLWALLLSIIGHLLFVSAYAALFLALTDVPPMQIMAITLLALLTRSVPISFLGVEVSDGSLVVLGQLLGIDPSLSLAVVAVVLIGRYMFALIGFLWEMMMDGLGFLANATRNSAA